MPRYTEQERDAIRNKYASEPLFKVSETACNFFDSQLHDYAIWPEEIFFESAHIIDEFKEHGEDLIPKIPQQWKILYSRLRSYDNTVPQEQLSLVTSIVLNIVAVVLRLSKDEVHQYMGKTLLNSVCENNRDWERVIVNLGNACNHFSHILYTWINDYMQLSNEQYLSDDINDLNNPPKKITKNKRQVPENKTYITFKMGNITEGHLKLLRLKLIEVGWIAKDTQPDTFSKLFSGKTNSVQLTWTGEVGKGMLLSLFRMMEDHHKIIVPTNHSLITILESHFVDKHGHYISDLNKSKETIKHLPIIQDCLEILELEVDLD